jgi:DNA-binding Lrp family transcriptional regulator
MSCLQAFFMDYYDSQILRFLSQNSRDTYLALSDEVGLRDTTIRKRILSLEQKGIIKKYTLLIDPIKFHAILTCAIIEINPANIKDSQQYFKSIDQVSQIFYSFSGRVICFISAVDDEGLSDVLKEISQIPGVKDIDLVGDLRIVKYDSLIAPKTIEDVVKREKDLEGNQDDS